MKKVKRTASKLTSQLLFPVLFFGTRNGSRWLMAVCGVLWLKPLHFTSSKIISTWVTSGTFSSAMVVKTTTHMITQLHDIFKLGIGLLFMIEIPLVAELCIVHLNGHSVCTTCCYFFLFCKAPYKICFPLSCWLSPLIQSNEVSNCTCTMCGLGGYRPWKHVVEQRWWLWEVKSFHTFLRCHLLPLWLSGVQDKPQSHTVHHLTSEWATLTRRITQTCVSCGLVGHYYFLACFLNVVHMLQTFPNMPLLHQNCFFL